MNELLMGLAGAFLVFGMLSKRLESSILTGPLAFTLIGLSLTELGWLKLHHQHEVVHVLAEVALVLVLFMDAARINLRKLRGATTLPARMLVLGIPLMVISGTLIGVLLFPSLSFWEVALIAAILAPTDAALGHAVVSTPAVPLKIRQALNVESGLNDGIALPVVLLFAALASMEQGAQGSSYWLAFTSKQLIFGPLVLSLIHI